jgi:hypothetical protein
MDKNTIKNISLENISLENVSLENISSENISLKSDETKNYNNYRFLIDPVWYTSELKQVVARTVRYNSHDILPKDERTVETFIYNSKS